MSRQSGFYEKFYVLVSPEIEQDGLYCQSKFQTDVLQKIYTYFQSNY